MGYRWDETLFVIAYDWRRSNRFSAGFLADQLPQILQKAAAVTYVEKENTQADIVAHSMGGLVTRAYIQDQGLDWDSGGSRLYADNVRKVTFIASPHRGFPVTYRTREGMTWSDYLYGDGSAIGNSWQALLSLLTDTVVWPTFAMKHYDPTVLELATRCQVIIPPVPAIPIPGFGRMKKFGINYRCPITVVKDWTKDPEKGIFSHLEMLPTNDMPTYLWSGEETYPFGRERNFFLEDLNASIDLLADRIGEENIYTIFGEGAATDQEYDVDEPGDIFWDHGTVVSVHETPDGDDLIPSYSLSLDDLVDLPEGNRIALDASDSGSEGGARHKEIVLVEDVQKNRVPLILTGHSVPFSSRRPPYPDPTGVIKVLSACPVHLLLTDPLGRRVGYDPATQTLYEEIPGAIYGEPGKEPEMILVPRTEEGEYQIQVIGYEEGEFYVRADLFTEHANVPLGQIFGDTSVGEIDTLSVTVSGPAPPTAEDDSATTPEDTPVLIDVLANDSDPNGDLLTIIEAEVFLGQVTIEADGRLLYVPAPDFAGTETLTYVIRDASGFEAGANVEVTVTPVNDPPIAEITPPLTVSGPAPLTARFQATASIDVDGVIVDWQWDFGDGESAQGEDVEHTFLLAGRHTVELTVTDDQGATGTDTLEIVVTGVYRTLFVVAPDSTTGGLLPGDQAVADRLTAGGVQIDATSAIGVSTADATGYDLVLISSTPSSAHVGSKFRDVPIPVATWESHILDDMGMTEGTAQLDFGPEIGQTDLFLEPDNTLAPGLSGPLTIASESVTMTFGRAGNLALGAARNPQRFERLHLFGYEAGDPMVGLDAPERRLSLFLSDATATSLTEEGWALFDSAICWAVNCSGDALARFSFEPVEGEPLTLAFDGSLSRPGRDQGQIATLLEWSWRTGDTIFMGGPADAQQWTVAFDEAGLYEVELTVTDSEGRIDTLVRQIQVGPTSQRALFVVGSLGLGAGDREGRRATERSRLRRRRRRLSGGRHG